MKIKEPAVIKNLLSDEDFFRLNDFLQKREPRGGDWERELGRNSFVDPLIDEIAEKLVPIARDFFESDKLLSTYSLFGQYEGPTANLPRHKDANACTYTLDLCVYQTEPWDLGVKVNGEDKFYTLYPNEALAYYGEDQEHWRPEFPNPETQKVAMIFFHFVEPEHWWFTKGPSYVNVIRGHMPEHVWREMESKKK